MSKGKKRSLSKASSSESKRERERSLIHSRVDWRRGLRENIFSSILKQSKDGME
jgi:hypothetical protein